MAKRMIVGDDEIFPYLSEPNRYVAVKLTIGIAPNMELKKYMKEMEISDELSPVWIVFDKGEDCQSDLHGKIKDVIDNETRGVSVKSKKDAHKELTEKLLKISQNMINEMVAKMLVVGLLREITSEKNSDDSLSTDSIDFTDKEVLIKKIINGNKKGKKT